MQFQRKIRLAFLLGASLALLPGQAFAGASVRLTTGGLVTPSPEFELVSQGEGMPTMGLIGGYALDDSFSIEVGLHYAGTQATLFGNQYGGLRLLTLELTAGYYQPLWKSLGTSVRLGVLGDLARLQLLYQSTQDRFRCWAAGFGLEGLLGLEIRSSLESRRHDGTIRGTGRAVHFLLEAGYRWRPGALPFHHLKRKVAREAEVDRIELDTIDAGRLRLSGAVIQVSAGLSF